MAVSITSTVNVVFGSEVLDPVTGVILNDEVSVTPKRSSCQVFIYAYTQMADFSTPGVPNIFGFYPSPCMSSPPNIIFSFILTSTRFDTDNYPQPGKRPLSSITPTIIENLDGSLALSIGGSGGSKIFPAVFQTLVNLDWGLDASEAVEYGRLHDQLFPYYVEADNVFPSNILEEMKVKGHNITGE